MLQPAHGVNHKMKKNYLAWISRLSIMNLYKKSEIIFAIAVIALYCAITVPTRGRYGDESIQMLLVLVIGACLLTLFIVLNDLEEKYGLTKWPMNTKRFLFFIPMWILVTGNLWNGVVFSYTLPAQICITLSMLIIGYNEEILFRGLLFKAFLKKYGIVVATLVSSLSFGMGHILNIFIGQANLTTYIQIVFALSWGFMFSMVYYKSGSILPCIVAHSLVDLFSTIANYSKMLTLLYISTTIIVAIAYGIYLSRLRENRE